jgi:O-antigen/teichoic acid export membrane protein
MAEKKQSGLKQKAASGMVWTAFQKYSKIGIQFVSGIILARMLTPYDYGCIGMLSIFMVLAEAFIEGGFGSALIQKKRPTQVDYSTIFWWNIGMAFVMYLVLFVSAPAISRFYKIPLLSKVLRVQGLVLFIYSLNVIQRNQLKKQLNFKLLSIVSIVTSLIALGVTVFMAHKGFGVWALVAQNIVLAFIPSLVFWFYVRWRPIWTFSWSSFKELFSFGLYMFLTHLVNTLATEIQGLLIGKLYSPATMGYYSKARGTERLASHSISSIMTQVTYPLYAEVQDDRAALRNMIKRLSMTVSYFTVPILFILLLAAKPIFLLLYSDRWLASVPYFQALCVAGLAACLQSVNLQSISAIGKSKTMLVWTLIKRGVSIVLIVGGLFLFGMKGLLTGVIISSWLAFLVNISLVSKHIGYKWNKQLLDIMPVFVVATLSAVVSYGVGYVLKLNVYVDGVVKVAVYTLLYLGWSFVFKPEAYQYFKTIIPLILLKFKRNKKKSS